MNDLKDKRDFKTALERLIRNFVEGTRAVAPPPYVGATNRDPLEHTTRAYFIDNLLAALGWDLVNLNNNLIEEASIDGERSLRLDYLAVRSQTREPTLIVEAKAWSKPFVTHSERAAVQKEGAVTAYTPTTLIAAAIEHCKAGKSSDTSVVSSDWAKWMEKLCEYVRAVHQRSGHIVSRVAITSGQWLVIFRDPNNAFIQEDRVEPALIHVFVIEDFVAHSSDIFDHLARTKLSPDPPPFINPSHLTSYATAPLVKRIYRGLWINHQEKRAHFDAYPQLHLYAAAVIERTDGVLITVLDGRSPNSIPHDRSRLGEHFDLVDKASDNLLEEIGEELGEMPTPSSVELFPGFNRPRAPSEANPGVVPIRTGPDKVLTQTQQPSSCW